MNWNSPEEIKDLFLRSFPVKSVQIKLEDNSYNFYTVEDSSQFLKPILEDTSRITFGTLGQIIVTLAGELEYHLPIESKQQAILGTQINELGHIVPPELIESASSLEYIPHLILNRLAIDVHNNQYEGLSILPEEFLFEFGDNILREMPTSAGQGIESLPDDVRDQFYHSIRKMFVDMSSDILASLPPLIRDSIEKSFGVEIKGEVDSTFRNYFPEFE